jgi:uncharacterized protein with FMN-binding domain
MKYVLFLVVSLIVILTAGCVIFGGRKSPEQVQVEQAQAEQVQAEQAQIEQKKQKHDQVYEGSAFGYRGPIYVQVRMSGGSISEITVVDSDEDRFVGGVAMEELIETVTELNSADVDAISGATITSKGFLEAVRNAIMSYE